jgi:dTDP-glucose 4,6-dehydratase
MGEVGESYNIGGGNQPANIEIVRTICEILDQKDLPAKNKPYSQLIEYVQDRPGHDRRYAMNISKIKNELRWQPKWTLEDGLRKTVDWYLDNIQWLKAIIEEKNFENWLTINYKNRGDL